MGFGTLQAPCHLLLQAVACSALFPGQTSSTSSFKKKGWKEEVIHRFQELCIQDTVAPSACRRLVVLKDAIRDCSTKRGRLVNEEVEESKLPSDDILGYTMACIKALQRGSDNRVRQLRSLCSQLAAIVPENPQASETASLCASLRDEAVKLSRQIIAADLRDLSDNPPADQRYR